MDYRRHVRWAILAAATAGLGGAHPVRAQVAPAPAESADVALARTIQEQEAILTAAVPGTGVTIQQREEAARRLVQMGGRGREVLLRVLTTPGNTPPQLAAARALINDARVDAAMIDPVANLMGPQADLTDAAARALANYAYRGSGEAWARLARQADDNRYRTRAIVVRAMGRLEDQQVARWLADHMSDEDGSVREAAANALVELSGQEALRGDPTAIRNWWEANRSKSDRQWREDVRAPKAGVSEENTKRLTEMRDAVRLQYAALYRSLPDAQKPQLLSQALESPSEDMRLVGVRLTEDLFHSGQGIPPAVKAQLKRMIGDSSVDVRREVAQNVQNSIVLFLERADNPEERQGIQQSLLRQLAQEQDREARARLVGALGRAGDLTAVPALVAAVRDPAARIAGSAAWAMRDLGEQIRKANDPKLSASVRDALRARLATSQFDPVLRQRIVQAMTRVADPEFHADFNNILARGAIDIVMIASLEGLWQLGNPNSGAVVAPFMNHNNRGIRLAAVQAMRTTGSPADIDALMKHLNPRIETDPDIRKAAWESILALADKADVKDLDRLANRLLTDPAVRSVENALDVLLIEERKLVQAQTPAIAVAPVWQNIGQCYAEIAKPVQAKATEYLRKALDAYVAAGAPQAVVEPVVAQLIRAMLLDARDRKEDARHAAAFVIAKQVAALDAAYITIVFGAVQQEVKELVAAGRQKQAIELLDEAEKAALSPGYAGRIRDLKKFVGNNNHGGSLWWEWERFEYVGERRGPGGGERARPLSRLVRHYA